MKELRAEKKISQKDLAKMLFVSPQAVSKWERDEATPNPAAIVRMAEIFEVTADNLLGVSSHQASAQQGVRIPVLGTVPAGIPLEAVEDIIDWEEIPLSMCSGEREYFGLRVQGNSMYPDYLEGDTVIIRKSPTCENGDVCVVYVNGYDATLKQVKLGEDGTLTLLPRNPEYAPRTYTAEEVTELPVSICGVVVELRRKINS